ncbi:MAG TPA: ribonuclease P protein component [Candidatus Acidoferrales bacterium]|nr:ribonuclease P protein component [Candidatus Acidoferrales bacterium]
MRWFEGLRRQAEIAHVRRRGRRASTGNFTAYAADLGTARPRVAITVAKTVGKAVVRNRIRRRVRGALDALGPQLAARTGLLVVARPQAAQASYAQLAADVAVALRELNRSAVRGR